MKYFKVIKLKNITIKNNEDNKDEERKDVKNEKSSDICKSIDR